MRDLGMGYCGLVCSLCSENEHCKGCKQGDCKDREHCKHYQCCTTKGYQSCYECPVFPCSNSMFDKPRIQAFCAFAGQYGEERLITCLKQNEAKGLQYHYPNAIVGDYDNATAIEEIIALILQENIMKG